MYGIVLGLLFQTCPPTQIPDTSNYTESVSQSEIENTYKLLPAAQTELNVMIKTAEACV